MRKRIPRVEVTLLAKIVMQVIRHRNNWLLNKLQRYQFKVEVGGEENNIGWTI